MASRAPSAAASRGAPPGPTRPVRRRPDLVDRDFTATGPNRLWTADLSYLRCWDGVVFFAFILDAWSRRVVGWQLAGHMGTTLVLDALHGATPARPGRRRRAGAPLRSRPPVHLDRLHPEADRSRPARLGRLGRRRLRHSVENGGARRCRVGLTLAYDFGRPSPTTGVHWR